MAPLDTLPEVKDVLPPIGEIWTALERAENNQRGYAFVGLHDSTVQYCADIPKPVIVKPWGTGSSAQFDLRDLAKAELIKRNLKG